MAWVTPMTFLASVVLTSAQLNTHLRDNVMYLKGVVEGSSADKIPNSAFYTNNIGGDRIVDNSLAETKLAGGIPGVKMADNSIADSKLVAGINGAKLSNATVPEAAIAFGTKLIGNQSYGIIRAATDISVANATSSMVNLNTTVSLQRASLLNFALTVTDAGMYMVGASVVWTPNATGQRVMTVNAGGVGSIVQDTRLAGGSNDFARQSGSTLRFLSGGTELSLIAYQDSGGALVIKAFSDASPMLWAVRVA